MDDTAGKAHNARDLLAERAKRRVRAAIDPGVIPDGTEECADLLV